MTTVDQFAEASQSRQDGPWPPQGSIVPPEGRKAASGREAAYAAHFSDAAELAAQLQRIAARIAAGRIRAADAAATEAALRARLAELGDDDEARGALAAKAAGERPRPKPKAARGRRRPAKRREKMFGVGRPRALDRNAKARIMTLARALMRRTEPGKAYGAITAKALAVLEALLWGFHNAKSGLCFPSYERIAEAAHCARSTVYEAIAALEAAGLLTWVNRIKRVRESAPGLPGVGATRVRVVRTSNAYAFSDPLLANSSKSDLPSGTANQASIPLHVRTAAAAKRLGDGLVGSISRLHDAVGDCQLEKLRMIYNG